MRIPRFAAHPNVTALMYSGPLSQRMTSGLPRHSMIRSSKRTRVRTAARSRPRSETLAVEIIDDVEQPDVAPIGKLIVHEVHRPALVNGHRHCQRQRLFAHQAMARLDPQVQLELAINLVDALLVPFEAFHVTQVQEAQTESPVAQVVRQPYQPVGNEIVFRIRLGL
jgi:hypothetical protein